MYSAPNGLAAGSGAATLAYTGVAGTTWMIIAAVALIIAGGAIMRFMPRKQS